ncbi:Enoyl-(Acyl carrier protein) reductase [Ceratobasidium sp. AG-Ba]|nr:Enoyl-(Acyl carrier protein) reductase [Ceratobasidium sp. AG-Ba]QRW05498.1 Enoyl-(Acyl carrier protein) reductase [Ceratobasidium sp. AG-Ba]
MSLLTGKVVIITGSSRGIGRACALEAARHGAKLVAHYLGDNATSREAESLKKEIEELGRPAVVVPGDIAKQATAIQIVETAVETFGRVDVLVSNAGICPFHTFLDMPPEVWEKTRSVNLDGSFYIVQAAAKQMEKQTPQGGSIIAVSSISALVGGGLQTHYTPTKAGTIATDINKDDLSDTNKREYMESRTCLGRLGVPEDLAGPVVFLASDMARYVTGASLLVDGGLFVNLQ